MHNENPKKMLMIISGIVLIITSLILIVTLIIFAINYWKDGNKHNMVITLIAMIFIAIIMVVILAVVMFIFAFSKDKNENVDSHVIVDKNKHVKQYSFSVEKK